MVKRIFIMLFIYTVCIIIITVFIPQDGILFVAGLVLTGLLLCFFIVREVAGRYLNKTVSVSSDALPYHDRPISGMLKISQKPFLFGFERKIVSPDTLYFDQDFLYAVNRDRGTAKFSMKNITELKRTSLQINNSRIWQVKIKHQGPEIVFAFAHNFSLFNKNFLHFYTRLQAVNPSAIQSEWNLWKM